MMMKPTPIAHAGISMPNISLSSRTVPNNLKGGARRQRYLQMER